MNDRVETVMNAAIFHPATVSCNRRVNRAALAVAQIFAAETRHR
jgi:hypothetical protein